jgi:hypothetical protein
MERVEQKKLAIREQEEQGLKARKERAEALNFERLEKE